MEKTRTTVKDVALKAGVSPSTVSRVISNNPRISKATKELVMKVMDEMNYHPNMIARSLANNTTKVIGVVIPYRSSDTLLNPFFPEALRGIIKSAKVRGYDVLISSNSNLDEELVSIKNLVNGSKVDGILLMASRDKDKNIEYLKSVKFPFSVIGSANGFRNLNHVDNDNEKASYDLTKVIGEKGRDNIYFASGDFNLTVSEQRLKGYKKALKDLGIEFDEDKVLIGNFDEETGDRFAKIISKLKTKPQAIVCTDDIIAYGLIKTLTESNIRIPEDIMVASFNNSVLSRYSNIPITSVDINAYDLGYESIKILVDELTGYSKEKQHSIIKHEIILRASTDS